MNTPAKPQHFFIVDDDNTSIAVLTKLLENAGHRVSSVTSSSDALKHIINAKPDCILSDLLMPDIDGLDLLQSIQQHFTENKPKFIIITGKLYEFDRRRAFELGVDGYLTKPVNPEKLVDELHEIMNETITVQFWGIRGTLPIPGKKTIRYGGNTNCVTLSIAHKHFFIFDAGSGIKELSNHLVALNHFPMSAKIFISHPHYDHINGLPFFKPLYLQGNEFEIFGTNHGELTIEKLIANQMDSVYFPITTKEFSANLSFRNLKEETFNIDDIQIQTLLLNHPGRCLGYRIQYNNKSFCYITDNELYLENDSNYSQFEVDRLVKFIQDCHVLVIDSTYTDEDYCKKTGWGHSCVSRVIDIADKAKVKQVCLYHHDMDEFDNDIDAKLKAAKAQLKLRQSKTRCLAPREGSKIFI